MTVEKAYKIAARGRVGRLTHCYDIGNAFAFYFDEGDGTPFVVVSKKDGEVELMHIPPVSNIKKLENGTKIPIEMAAK